MINKVGNLSVFVADQDRAKDFYINVLGMELRTEAPLYPGATTRWIAVAPPGAETDIILYLPDENWEHYRQTVGKSQAMTLDCTHLVELVADLKARGVVVTMEPDPNPWGTIAMIKDSEDNTILLVEEPPRS